MKLLHINCNYLGTALHQEMIKRLGSLGTDNTVFVPVHPGTKAVIQHDDNVVVSRCFKKWDRLFFDLKQKKILSALEKSVSVPDFNVIHAYTLFTDGNAARALFRKYGIPYVVAVRNTDVNTFFKYALYLRKRGIRIMEDAQRVFFLSPSYRQQVMDKYVPESKKQKLLEKSVILPNGIDDFWFDHMSAPKPAPDGEIRLIYAGRIDKNKNVAATQKAMELLRSQNIRSRLTVVGRIDDQAEYEHIMQDPYTEYKSAMPKQQLIDEYRNSDVFIMPSHHETFGLVYGEAMSQGLPVIYTKGQGFDGQFPEGTVGFSVDENDPGDIAAKIRAVTEQYTTISRNCLKMVEKFRWPDIAGRYADIYSAISPSQHDD